MKYTIALMLLISSLTNAISQDYYQSDQDRVESNDNIQAQDMDRKLQHAGGLLKQYSKDFYIGTGLQVGGVLLLAGSSQDDNAIQGAATLMLLGGFVLQLLSHRHIGKAGKILIEGSKYGYNSNITNDHNQYFARSNMNIGFNIRL